MLQAGGETDLALKPLEPEPGRELLVQHLHGNGSVMAQVASEVDRRHASAPELPLDRVAPLEIGPQPLVEVGHLVLEEDGGPGSPAKDTT